MNIPSLYVLTNYASQNRKNIRYISANVYKKEIEEYNNNDESKIDIAMEYANMLTELEQSYNIILGDLGRKSNWGIYNNKPVVIDVGFTENTKVYYK